MFNKDLTMSAKNWRLFTNHVRSQVLVTKLVKTYANCWTII